MAGIEAAPTSLDVSWYLVQLKPGGLSRARSNLSRLGFGTFIPCRDVTVKRRARFVRESRPLFPGYLFVAVGHEAPAWRVINSTYGVSRVVCLEAGRPTRVPGDFMRALQASCDAEGNVMSPAALDVGQAVRMVAGPFAGTVTRIVEAAETERIYVLLDIMGRTVRAAVSRGDIEAVQS